MVKSMTGYGQFELEADGLIVKIELKSVNHRYIDFFIRTPRRFSFLEDRTREYLKKHINRGKIDVNINVESTVADAKSVTLNADYACKYIQALEQIRDMFGVSDDISVSTVARNMDVFDSEYCDYDADTVWDTVSECLRSAVNAYNEMRQAEGARLCSDMMTKLGLICVAVEKISARSPEVEALYKERLTARINEALGSAADEGRILTEVAIFAEKASIDEEIVRLNSHIKGFEQTLRDGGAVGKKLDFILQEMNREINTIGSKANNIEISKTVIDVKSELEKIREQIQNIE